jgi:hypothetical protein
MEIGFATLELSRLCSSDERLCARWGQAGGRRVGARLLQMRAAPTLADLAGLPGRCRELPGHHQATVAIDVGRFAVILFQPTGGRVQDTDGSLDRSLDWSMVRRVSILRVIDL